MRRSTDPWYVVSRFLRDRPHPVVFDVGANVGQTATHCSRMLPGASVYSFEPSPTTYRALRAAVSRLPNVQTFNIGMGEQAETLTLLENSGSDMSSFLRPDRDAWGEIVRETPVEVWSVDRFREVHNIDRIDILKTDTQGFDLAVLRGARETLAANGVDVILTEVIFGPMYEGIPRFDELLGYALDYGFRFVGLYGVEQQHGVPGWADALLVHERLLAKPESTAVASRAAST
jgi:FkbM family methyltransferase